MARHRYYYTGIQNGRINIQFDKVGSNQDMNVSFKSCSKHTVSEDMFNSEET